MKEKITLTLFCEKEATLISKIVLIFTRKKIKIDHFCVDSCEQTLLYKIRIGYWDHPSNTNNMVALLERIIEVFSCYSQNQEELETHQIKLFKIPILHKDQITHFPVSFLFQEKEYWICCGKIINEHFYALQNTLKKSTLQFN
ncbi:hypothetical protein [Flavobacterium succinicans]|uniref:Uncharacterized protein n=1 Tax=Flavobacterium succinicans TaxID=29536 RepID=A0A199XN48_9FLAO|nr:hypothetical protein [Flavobacterium succinicans]OAZ02779.1 hypothetical protein FLB_27530 [Flavobacterium succinicans]